VFVDDSLAVLRAARAYGIRQLITVKQPDSRQPAREIVEFPAIASFRELMP
jgi:putative hydrolase of the HAD superfamily